jgi:hypothetical protein
MRQRRRVCSKEGERQFRYLSCCRHAGEETLGGFSDTRREIRRCCVRVFVQY